MNVHLLKNKAIFWDFQGTLGGDATGSILDFEFYPFSYEALKLSKEKGYMNIVITNQSGIGKGKLTMEAYEYRVEQIKEGLRSNKVSIEEFLCCPHTSQDNCTCKKTKTALIDFCVEKYHIDLSKSYVIGDMGKNEIGMAKAAGMKGILVMTGAGRGSLNEFRHTWRDYEADVIADNALEAIRNI